MRVVSIGDLVTDYYYKNEKYTEAEINYRRSLDADPSSSMAVYNIGNALFRQGKYDEAARQYENLTGRERPADEKTVYFSLPVIAPPTEVPVIEIYLR